MCNVIAHTPPTVEADDGEGGGSYPLPIVEDTADIVSLLLHLQQEFVVCGGQPVHHTLWVHRVPLRAILGSREGSTCSATICSSILFSDPLA